MEPGQTTSAITDEAGNDQESLLKVELDNEDMCNIKNALSEAFGPLKITHNSISAEVE